jgi:hypothetical protein
MIKSKTINERVSVSGAPAREIITTILPKLNFAKADVQSQKDAKVMINDLVKTLNDFYQKYNIDKRIVI